MRRAPFRHSFAVSALALALCAPSAALAGDTPIAEHLFQEGLDAMRRNDFAAACVAFNGSNEADASPGTQINLALCNEKQGKIASAWGWYRTAAGLADQRGQKERAQLARAEEAKLAPKLRRVAISVSPVPDAVLLDGKPIPVAAIATPIPLDPGDHTFEFSAKGKKTASRKVTVVPTPGVDHLDVVLDDAPPEPAGAGAGAAPAGGDYTPVTGGKDGSTQRSIGLIMGGAGLLAGVVTVVLVVTTLSAKESRDEQTTNVQKFTKELADLKQREPNNKAAQDQVQANLDEAARSQQTFHDAAKGNQTAAIITGIAGGALLIGGVVLILTAPSGSKSGRTDAPKVLPLVGSGTYGFGLGGTF